MSGGQVVDDPVVRAAIQLLPVPEHGDDFWDDLRLALDAEAPVQPGPATAPAPSTLHPVPPTLVPSSLRRPANAVLVAVAVAAAVVVALAGQSLLANRTGTGPNRRSSAPTELEALVARSQPPDSTPEALSSAQERSATDAVLAWVGAVAAGETAGAWEALGPVTKAHYGDVATFEAGMADLADAYAAWASGSTAAVVVTPVVADGSGTLAVVTLISGSAAQAVPVRLADGEAVVEPVGAVGLEMVAPAADPDAHVGRTLAAGDEILIVLPVGVDAPLLRIDDGGLVVCGETDGSRLTTLDDGSAQRCAYLPPEGMPSGRHTLTVAFRASDGDALTARSVLFDAA